MFDHVSRGTIIEPNEPEKKNYYYVALAAVIFLFIKNILSLPWIELMDDALETDDGEET